MTKIFHFAEFEIPFNHLRKFFTFFIEKKLIVSLTQKANTYVVEVKYNKERVYYFYLIPDNLKGVFNVPTGKIKIYHQDVYDALINAIEFFKIDCQVFDNESNELLIEYTEGKGVKAFTYELNEGALEISINLLLTELAKLISEDNGMENHAKRISEIEEKLNEYHYAYKCYKQIKR